MNLDLTFQTAVRTGLLASPKWLPPWLFYDAAGSELFERITGLPEYYPTRLEREVLQDHADEILGTAGPLTLLAELGSGSSRKTRILLERLMKTGLPFQYLPIDVSAWALAQARARLAAEWPGLGVLPMAGSYEEVLPRLAAHPGPRMVLFLGSSLGNFHLHEAHALLTRIRRHLSAGDTLLLGLDLAKDPGILLPAYDDREGVTARFNLNLLARLNREAGANFDLNGFLHRAIWNPLFHRVEMHLESMANQTVSLPALDLEVNFQPGERLHTESSYKYHLPLIKRLFQASGWEPCRQWRDPGDWFSISLARVPAKLDETG
jgi:dimethylhistidine N-methyltransferase